MVSTLQNALKSKLNAKKKEFLSRPKLNLFPKPRLVSFLKAPIEILLTFIADFSIWFCFLNRNFNGPKTR